MCRLYIYIMNTIQILNKLEKVNFTEKQAKAIAEVLEEKEVSRDFLYLTVNEAVSKAKWELIKWIVGAVVINGIVAALLKYASG